MYGLDPLVFYSDSLMGDDITKEFYLILVETALLEIGVQ